MTKAKEKLYEHRYGLFFFLFLMGYSFIFSGGMQPWRVTEVGYSFHAVDFSIGFCTKLLPGAICNFLFDEITKEKVTVYLNFLIILVFLTIAYFLEKLLLSNIKHKKALLIISVFFLTGPATFSIYLQIISWLDFYWLIAAILSIIFLQRKETYILVIPAMLFAIMSHYAAILCYVPFVCIYMLYKISDIKDKKEKVFLWLIWTVTVVSSLVLTAYMVINEVGNVKITYEELTELLSSRDARDYIYYKFNFYKDSMSELFTTEMFPEMEKYRIENIDPNQHPVIVLIKTIILQIKVNLMINTLSDNIIHFLLVLPVAIFLYKMLWYQFNKSKENKLKCFSILCQMMLYVVTVFFGCLFSEDTIRWLSHATLPMFILFFFLYKNEGEEFRAEVDSTVEKTPIKAMLPFLVIYMGTVGVA